MNTGRLRLRFLAALGLGGAACAAGSDAKHEPTTEPSGERATAVVSASSAPTSTAAASSSASTVATVATVATLPSAQTSSAPNVTPFAPASVSAWAPEAAPNASLAQLPPGIGPGEQHPTCPSGRTCVHQASRTIGQPPFPRCASSLPGAGAARVSDLNVEITTLERAGANKDACCYEWTIPCPGGRPLIVEGAPRIADTTVSSGWSAPGAALVLATLEAVERSALATHFAREAAYEHASVASFARVTLSLLAAAAPTELILDTQRAALDEVRHARAMFAVASALADCPLGPGALDVCGVTPTADLVDVALEALHEGFVGETVAAIVLAEESARAPAPLAAILRETADDEERHAELAFRTLAWALSAGGAPVREAVRAARDTLANEPAPVRPARSLTTLFVLDGCERATVRAEVIAQVVLPCLDALLANGAAPTWTRPIATRAADCR